MKVYGWYWRSNKRINVDWLGRYAPSPAGYALVVAAPGATDRRQPSAVGRAVTEYRNVASTQTMGSGLSITRCRCYFLANLCVPGSDR
jgi:hypothetical protein